MTLSRLSPVNPTIVANTSMNPHTCTRRLYTPGLATATLPTPNLTSNAWLGLAILLRDLYSKLGNHPAMASNLDQTFDTPANAKNSVYFMWDFIGRTLHKLYLVPAKQTNLTAAQKEEWEDVQGRAVYGAMLILNQPSGALEMMVKSAPHDKDDPMPDMGTEVEEAARAIVGPD